MSIWEDQQVFEMEFTFSDGSKGARTRTGGGYDRNDMSSPFDDLYFQGDVHTYARGLIENSGVRLGKLREKMDELVSFCAYFQNLGTNGSYFLRACWVSEENGCECVRVYGKGMEDLFTLPPDCIATDALRLAEKAFSEKRSITEGEFEASYEATMFEHSPETRQAAQQAEWEDKYGSYIEKNPHIEFEGKTFVFSGCKLTEQVVARGGQERSAVSGKTSYLVVDPSDAGERKVKLAIEQQQKGNPVRIVHVNDLKAALEKEDTISGTSDTATVTKAEEKKTSEMKNTKKARKNTTTYDYTDSIQFELPRGWMLLREENEDGEETVNVVGEEYENEDGETAYRCSCGLAEMSINCDETTISLPLSDIMDRLLDAFDVARFAKFPGELPYMLLTMEMPFAVFGTVIKMYGLACIAVIDHEHAINIVNVSRYNEDDPDENVIAYEHMMNVIKALRVNGKALDVESLNAKQLCDVLTPTFEDSDEAVDVSPKLQFEFTAYGETTTYEYTADGMKEVDKKTLQVATPEVDQYPHYDSISNNVFSLLGAAVNTTGTEYEFYSFDRMIHIFELEGEDEKKERYERIRSLNPKGYTLDTNAKAMMELFRVDEDVFDASRDRQAELDNNMMRRAYMMSALRSFAWTLAAYCSDYDTHPVEVSLDTLKSIVQFCEQRSWLNYDGKSYCKGICAGSDLHVYFLPDAVSKADKQSFLPSKEDLERVRKTKETFPNYNEILSEVHSLNQLRNDLEYIYPAVLALHDDLKEGRDTSIPLEGAESDVVYAFVALALAAQQPFFSEDGPVNYTLDQPLEEETAVPRQPKSAKAAKATPSATKKEKKSVQAQNKDVFYTVDRFTLKNIENDHSDVLILPKGLAYIALPYGFNEQTTTTLVIPEGYVGFNTAGVLYGDHITDVYVPDSFVLPENEYIGYKKRIHIRNNPAIEKFAASSSGNHTVIKEDWQDRFEYPEVTPQNSNKIFGGGLEINDTTVVSYTGDEAVVTVPDGVTVIGGHAFEGCVGIEEVILPQSVKIIEEFAFSQCANLKKINLLDGLTDIYPNAFQYCFRLNNVTIPHGIKKLELGTFLKCLALDSITLPTTVTNIGSSAFSRTAFREFPFHDKISVLGESVFSGCPNLKKAVIPPKVKSLKWGLFKGCEALEEVVLNEKLQYIGGEVFSGCSKLQEIDIPLSVTKIGSKSTTGVYCDMREENEPLVLRVPHDSPVLAEARSKKQYRVEVIGGEKTNAPASTLKPQSTEQKLQLTTTETQPKQSSVPQEIIYKIRYDVNGGIGNIASQKKRQGESIQITNEIPTHEQHCQFLGWSTQYNARQAQYRPGEIYTEDRSAKFYAVWKTWTDMTYTPPQSQPAKKEGCYIATAVYGSYDAPEVLTLRRFRDEVLAKSCFGRWFIRTYYRLSPPVAEKLKNAKHINQFVKSILDKWVKRLIRKNR